MSAPDTTLAQRVFPRLYRDSVTLMALAAAAEKLEGVVRVGAVMATPANLDILQRSQMLPEDFAPSPDDLVIVVRALDPDIAEAALDVATERLTAAEQASGPQAVRAPETVAEGLALDDEASVATVSTPGTYAPIVVEQALRAGLHVFCFSDNVSVAEEVRLKTLAVERRRLLMGPDCGTAILDGVPLGFANVVRPGPVSLVAASGTGAQEVSCLLDAAGVGVSQIIGVGGRDLSVEVGGAMTDLALDLVAEDEATQIVVVVSKPPAPEVADRLLGRLATLGKPAVACFLGAKDSDGAVPVRGTLEGGALAAAALAGGASLDLTAPAVERPEGLAGGVLGLYTGGTLASETKFILKSAHVAAEILDLGDDEYTTGRPHPMIDPAARADRVAAAGSNPEIGVVLVDLVLGHGSAVDPGTPLADAIRTARATAQAEGRDLVVLASVCGTAADPQGIQGQRALLDQAGAIVCPSNAGAARLAATLAGATALKGDNA